MERRISARRIPARERDVRVLLGAEPAQPATPGILSARMRVTLHYRGPLRSNGNPEHKLGIRRSFHKQLSALWRQPPLDARADLLGERKPGGYSLLRPMSAFRFAPLVSAEMHATADLSLVLLRPEIPGKILKQSGDIDNRLKTLLDALAVPPARNQLPPDARPAADEEPFFCLLEDDGLVTSVAVRTEQLLEPDVDPADVDVTIHVQTRVAMHTCGNDFLAT